jgi:hypothetical protein
VNGPTSNPTQNNAQPIAAADAVPTIVNTILIRSNAMQPMLEYLASVRSPPNHEELLRHEWSRRLVAARRAQRRAERSVARAQRLLALASVR